MKIPNKLFLKIGAIKNNRPSTPYNYFILQNGIIFLVILPQYTTEQIFLLVQ